MAEQIYQTTVYIGWPGMDDSATWRLYLRDWPDDAVHQQTKVAKDASNSSITLQDIEDIMVGVHLAATAESRAFTDAVGLNAEQMFDIVCGAAGWNVQFEKYALKMKKGPWYLREIDESKEFGARLAKAVTKAATIGANLPIASAAVQVYEMQVGPLSS
ncbi:hypothetical protein CEP52_011439 [Fusarium oligoseptatum]|uniref:Uncharacterized protein n=2 Tax=Fusarium solani species complex TaxID=232080 RepID=A0A428T310_9HYPO|nr:hypothetical protein CEP52_011439 [Fusarium oligoseptatum]